MPKAKITCPECGKEIGEEKSVYKHAVNCLNLPDRGIEYIERTFANDSTLRGERVMIMMRAAKAETE